MKQSKHPTDKPIAIDLFSGVGGMSLGFERAGFHVSAAIDVEPTNALIHKLNFPNCNFIQRDIATLDGRNILELTGLANGSVDVLFGGPPCQGFSLIGRREHKDIRNQMLLHFARLVTDIRPRYFVMENVPGLLLGKAKRLLNSFLTTVRSAGYEIVEPISLLNAADYGVPQKRQRVFILGCLKSLNPPLYPKPSTADGEGPTVWEAIGDLVVLDQDETLLSADRYFGKLEAPSEYAKEQRLKSSRNEGRRLQKGLGGCLLTNHSQQTRRRFKATAPGTSELISRFHKLDKNGQARTLRAGTGPDHGSHTAARPIHPLTPRCITTREAARLHSFPDWFEFHPTKWHGFRQVGNSVPPLLACAVATELLTLLGKGA